MDRDRRTGCRQGNGLQGITPGEMHGVRHNTHVD
jgi:hypothetical protein